MLGTLKQICPWYAATSSILSCDTPPPASLSAQYHYQVMIGPAAELVRWSGEGRYAYHALSNGSVLLLIPEAMCQHYSSAACKWTQRPVSDTYGVFAG